MNLRHALADEEPVADDFPTLCSIPLRPEWFDEVDRLDAVIVRGTD